MGKSVNYILNIITIPSICKLERNLEMRVVNFSLYSFSFPIIKDENTLRCGKQLPSEQNSIEGPDGTHL